MLFYNLILTIPQGSLKEQQIFSKGQFLVISLAVYGIKFYKYFHRLQKWQNVDNNVGASVVPYPPADLPGESECPGIYHVAWPQLPEISVASIQSSIRLQDDNHSESVLLR